MRALTGICFSCVVFAAVSQCDADIVDIGQFTGEKSENFDSFVGGTGGHSTLDVFDGNATLVKGDGGSVKVELRSTRGGDTVNPRSAPNFGGQFAVMEWIFHTPISEIGGYFENNSRFDDIEVSFYDAQDQLIGTRTATAPKDAQSWTWNGWRSDVAIHRITTAGNDVEFLNGFVWYDDMEINFAPQAIPEPAGCALACLIVVPLITRRRRPVK